MPVVRVEDRNYQQGRFAELARRLYFEFAEREGGRRPKRHCAQASGR
jgi:hypothetical protein